MRKNIHQNKLIMIILLSKFFSFIPLSLAMCFAQFMGWFWYYIIPIRKKVAIENLDMVLGQKYTRSEQRKIIRGVFTHLAMFAIDVFRLPHWTPADNKKFVKVENRENFEKVLAKNKGAILVAIHIGSFDLLGGSLGLSGVKVAGVFKDIKWKAANDFWYNSRLKTGLVTIPPRKSRNEIKLALADGFTIGFAIDQHMHHYRGIVCDFLGYPASTTPAPAKFSFETGAPIIPVLFVRDKKPGYHIMHFEKEFIPESPYNDPDENIRHNTERLNRIAEGWIYDYPEQWLWLHKRWKVMQHPEEFDIPDYLKDKIPVKPVSG